LTARRQARSNGAPAFRKRLKSNEIHGTGDGAAITAVENIGNSAVLWTGAKQEGEYGTFSRRFPQLQNHGNTHSAQVLAISLSDSVIIYTDSIVLL
jgi:hypothetical protein